MPILDIIVTHYNESREVYKKFFDMLNLQRGIDFNDIRVIIVNDGTDSEIDANVIKDCPYRVEEYCIEKAGVSAARNFGIDHSSAEWISFSDCDDVYLSVYSLMLILEILKDTEKSSRYDMFWTKFVAEDMPNGGKLKLNTRGNNLVFIHGKYYRRSFIVDNGIRFPEDLTFNEDSCFNAIANTYWDYRRTAEIKASFPLYVWCYRIGSLTGTPGNLDAAIHGSYQRNKKVCDVFEQRLPYERFCAMVARTVFDTYYVLNVSNLTPIRAEMLEDFRGWYKAHKKAFWDCDREQMKHIKDFSTREYRTGIGEQSIRWPGNPINPCIESTSVTRWLKEVVENE